MSQHCHGCPNYLAKPIRPRGRTTARIAVIRDHAYRESFHQREAGWDQDSLDILDWLIDGGVHESTVVFATLVGCPGIVPNSQLLACAGRLEQQLTGYQLDHMLAVGQAPALAVGIAGPVDKTRGRMIGQTYARRPVRIMVTDEIEGAKAKKRDRIHAEVLAFAQHTREVPHE